MKAVEHLYLDRLTELTLLAGDGDFRDLVSFIKEKAKKKVHIFSFQGSYKASLHESSTQGFFLDSIWERISVPISTASKIASLNPE